jgi:hypothetical protein
LASDPSIPARNASWTEHLRAMVMAEANGKFKGSSPARLNLRKYARFTPKLPPYRNKRTGCQKDQEMLKIMRGLL